MYLSGQSQSGSVNEKDFNEKEVKKEMKTESTILTNANVDETNECIFDISRFFSLKKTVRLWCLVRKAVSLFKLLLKRKRYPETDVTSKNVSPADFQNSMSDLIQMEQKRFFAEEIKYLNKGEKIPKGSSLQNLRLSIQNKHLVSIG